MGPFKISNFHMRLLDIPFLNSIIYTFISLSPFINNLKLIIQFTNIINFLALFDFVHSSAKTTTTTKWVMLKVLQEAQCME